MRKITKGADVAIGAFVEAAIKHGAGHGGHRPNSGAKPKPHGTKLVSRSVQFPPELLAELKATAKALHMSVSALVVERCTGTWPWVTELVQPATDPS